MGITGWVTLVGSKQFYDISFAQYDGYYGSWTDYNIEVPVTARNSGQKQFNLDLLVIIQKLVVIIWG